MKFSLSYLLIVFVALSPICLLAAKNVDVSRLFSQSNEAIEAYILQNMELLNSCLGPCRLTLLDYAIIKDNFEIVEFLLKKGANPNALLVASETSLHLAAELGKMEMVPLLLKFGADPNARSNIKSTPLAKVVRGCGYKIPIDIRKMAVIKILLPLTKIEDQDIKAMERCFKNLRRGKSSNEKINEDWQDFVLITGLAVQ